MKNLMLLITVVFLAAFVQLLPQQRGEGMRRIEQLEKLKLIEALNMDESTSVKFFLQRRDYYTKRRSLTIKVDSLYSALKEELSNSKKPDDAIYKKLTDELLSAEKALALLRTDYISSLYGLLNYEQVSRYVIFEKRFNEELRDMIEKHRKRKRNIQ